MSGDSFVRILNARISSFFAQESCPYFFATKSWVSSNPAKPTFNMTSNRERSSDEQQRSSMEKEINTVEHVEKSGGPTLDDEILQRYPLLAGKSEVEMALLNKKVLKKLDWKFLPCITFMLLMK
jgi:hypothetical protein